MTAKQERDFAVMYAALRTITRYQTPDHMRRHSIKEWGLPWEDTLEGAYENIQQTAKNAVKSVRLPKLPHIS